MFRPIIERFCFSAADALFWILIIMTICIAGSRAFRYIIGYMTEDVQIEKKEGEEGSEE